MPTINQLSSIGEVTSADQIPTYDESNGDTRKMSVLQLQDYMQDNLNLPNNSDEVNFLQAGTSAVERTVQSKLRDVVSVKDFGAKGDGVTDDTAAIQAAIDAAKEVIFPAGVYKTTTQINLLTQKVIRFVNDATLRVAHTGYGIYVNGAGLNIAGRDYCRIIGPKFKNQPGITPAAFVVIDFVQNVSIEDAVFNDCAATVGVLNLAGYNTRIAKTVFNWFTGTCIKLRQSIGDVPHFSYNISIREVDISNNTGVGIDIGGGSFSILNSVIEGCSLGAIKFCTDGSQCNGVLTSAYFEANQLFSVNAYGDNGGNFPTVAFVACKIIGISGGDSIGFGPKAHYTFDSCFAGGIAPASFTGSGKAFIKNCINLPVGNVPSSIKSHVYGQDVFFDNATATQINSLNVNANFGGGGALIAVSSATNAGNATVSELWHIRFGVDGNNFAASSLSKLIGGGSAATFAFSVDANGYLVVTASSAGFACYYQVIARWN